uniref:Uncharacterized protein n=1 Tax=Rhizophora mucronata TaxID=61149 RepID=A0A2P2ILK8_RHIMU
MLPNTTVSASATFTSKISLVNRD